MDHRRRNMAQRDRHRAQLGVSVALRILLLLAVSATPPAHSLRIIAAPLLAISPAMDVMGVAAQLHSRGHKVLVVVTQSALGFVQEAAARQTSNTTAAALRYELVNLTWREAAAPPPPPPPSAAARPAERAPPPPSPFAVPSTWPASALFAATAGLRMVTLFQPGAARIAGQLLANGTLMQRLRDFDADAVMSVGLSIGGPVADNSGCLLAHALGVQAVDVSGNTFFEAPWNVPQFGSGLAPPQLATPAGAALNTATWAYTRLATCVSDVLRPRATAALRAQHGLPQAASNCAAARLLQRLAAALRGGWRRSAAGRRASAATGATQLQSCAPLLEVKMASWVVECPRQLRPNQVVVGPGTPRPARVIAQPAVAAFVEGADPSAGVVLVAFGTAYGRSLLPEDVTELAAGFAALEPRRVLWALKQAALPAGVQLSKLPLGDNTMVVPWVDYNDVLGHPNTRAFVSHCGLHSVNEAAWHGVPVVALPFQFEQVEHATKLVSQGAGVVCHQAPAFRTGPAAGVHFTRQHVAQLVQQVVGNRSYAAAAGRIAAAMQTYAARRHPYERAADEVELALGVRHVQQAAAHEAAAAAAAAHAAAAHAAAANAAAVHAAAAHAAAAGTSAPGLQHHSHWQQQQQQQQRQQAGDGHRPGADEL